MGSNQRLRGLPPPRCPAPKGVWLSGVPTPAAPVIIPAGPQGVAKYVSDGDLRKAEMKTQCRQTSAEAAETFSAIAAASQSDFPFAESPAASRPSVATRHPSSSVPLCPGESSYSSGGTLPAISTKRRAFLRLPVGLLNNRSTVVRTTQTLFASLASSRCLPSLNELLLHSTKTCGSPTSSVALQTLSCFFSRNAHIAILVQLLLWQRLRPSIYLMGIAVSFVSLCLLAAAASAACAAAVSIASRAVASYLSMNYKPNTSITKRRLTPAFQRPLRPLRLLFLLASCVLLETSFTGDAKKVLGLARDYKFQPIAEFCFTIPPGQHGRVVAQTVVDVPGQELIIVNRTEHRALLAAASGETQAQKHRYEERNERESGDEDHNSYSNNSSSSSSNGGEDDNSTPSSSSRGNGIPSPSSEALCEQLLRAARVREPLRTNMPLQFQSDLPWLFELDLLTRCRSKQPLDAMYSIQFLNPGGYWQQHFSCDEQGLLQLYLVTLFFCGICAVRWWGSAWRAALSSSSTSSSSSFSSHPPSRLTASPPSLTTTATTASSSSFYAVTSKRSMTVAAGSLSACGLLTLAVLLYTLHLSIYAENGLGVVAFKFLSQFFEACSRCVLCVAFGALAARGCCCSSTAASVARGTPTPPSSSSSSFSAAAAAVAGPLQLSLGGRKQKFAAGAVVGYILLQVFNLVAEYSLPLSTTQVCAYPLFRTGWGMPSVLGSALVAALLLMEAAPHLASAASLHDGPLLRYRLLLAACTTFYFLVPLLLLLFFPASQ